MDIGAVKYIEFNKEEYKPAEFKITRFVPNNRRSRNEFFYGNLNGSEERLIYNSDLDDKEKDIGKTIKVWFNPEQKDVVIQNYTLRVIRERDFVDKKTSGENAKITSIVSALPMLFFLAVYSLLFIINFFASKTKKSKNLLQSFFS